jgi:hypothetical protein
MNKSFNMHSLRKFWYEQISCRIWPRQKWLTKQIPKTWQDKDGLIEDLVFACLVNFWEAEDGEESLRLQYIDPDNRLSDERRAKFRDIYQRLNKAYFWAVSRKALWDDPTLSPKELVEQEAVLTEKDSYFLKEIIELREYLWT